MNCSTATIFLALLCAGPVPMAVVISAMTTDSSSTAGTASYPTPAPIDGGSPSSWNISSLIVEGGDGSACSSYDQDERVASLIEGSCEWNMYMCCWTGYDGPGGMAAFNTSDVCRVLDYPEDGDSLELPNDSEGPVVCHGFGWPNGSDVSSYILPLYNYVTNFKRTVEGGFYGNVEGAPECGCIEDMPIVDDAACSRHSRDGIEPCTDDDLWRHYRSIGEPKGPMESNLVRECDNNDVPEHDFRACEHNTYMCCWTENDGQGMIDNTDVCHAGGVGYPGESEGEVHCHGFVWKDDATDGYIHTLAQWLQNFGHRDNRGYYGNIPGSPMCGCVEEMAQVSRSDCTTYNATQTETRGFDGCNDLRRHFVELYPDDVLPNLVVDCDNA